MIKTQLGLEKAINQVRKLRKSIKKFITIQKEKSAPFERQIEKVKEKLKPEIKSLQTEEAQYMEEIYSYIEDNDYANIPGFSIRKLHRGKVRNMHILVQWLLRKNLLDYLSVNEQALAKLAKDSNIPGWEPMLDIRVVIQE